MHTPLHTPQQLRAGFTLIEVVVTTGLLAMIMLGVTSMFMTFLISSARTNATQLVKGEGGYTASRIEYLLRNAKGITSACPTTSNRISFTAVDPNDPFGSPSSEATLDFELVSGTYRIFYNNLLGTKEYLTSTSVQVDNLWFRCRTASSDQKIVEYGFSLSKQVPSINTQSAITETFRGTVQIRN